MVENSEGLKIEGKWKFPIGKDALANPKMDYFDFREKNPGRLVLDFWVKSGPTVSEVHEVQIKVQRLAALKKAEEETRKKVELKRITAKLKAESEDVGRFCRLPLGNESDIFLPLLPVHDRVDFTRWFATTTADTDFPYFEPKTKSKDAQYVRLALSFYREGKLGLVVRTLDFFDNEYPHSPFRNEMKFLRANAMIKLGMNAEAQLILGQIMESARSTPVALYSGMYLAGKLIEKGAYLASLERFLWLIHHYPDNRLAWVFHLGAAESLYSLKQTDRAAKEYEWIVENAPRGKAKAEGALRAGDLYLSRFQYEQALASYFQGLHKFEEESKEFPPVYINRAETLYGLGEYERARDAFKEFLRKFPGHPSGWRATFGLGEIYARQVIPSAPGENPIEVARTWYYDTINHFPQSPGSTLARLRLLPCGDQGGFTMESAERFFEGEAKDFDGRGEVSIALYRDFRAIAHVRSLITFGNTDKAVDVAIEELASINHTDTRVMLGGLLGTLFRKTIIGFLDTGKKYEALKFYNEKWSLIPKGSRVDPDYLLKLSQAAADLGLGTVAEQLVDSYNKISQIRSLASVSTLMHEPENEAELEKVLKRSEKNFTQAKALWIAEGSNHLSPENALKIRDLLAKVEEESRFSYEKELILGLMEDQSNHKPQALIHALKAQLLIPNPQSPRRDLRLDAWIASLTAQTGDDPVALDLYRALEARLTQFVPERTTAFEPDGAQTLGVPPIPAIDQIGIAEATLLEKQKRWGEASIAYERAMTKGWGGNQAVFGYAHSLIQSGQNTEKAFATLEKLAQQGKQGDFWSQLAKQTLEDEKSRNQLRN